ncbi:MAG: hypothetical protein ABEI13_02320, partial [Candidatus Paceibacteria bacterium]
LEKGSTIWEEVEGVLENKGLDSSNERVQELVHSYLNSEGGAEDMFNRAMDIPDGQEYLQQIGGEHPTIEDVRNMSMDQKHELARRLGPGELPHLDNILEQQLHENVTDATSPESPNSGNISEPNQETLEKSNSEASSQQTTQRPDQENVPPSEQQYPLEFTVSSEPSDTQPFSDTEPASTEVEQQSSEQPPQDQSNAEEPQTTEPGVKEEPASVNNTPLQESESSQPTSTETDASSEDQATQTAEETEISQETQDVQDQSPEGLSEQELEEIQTLQVEQLQQDIDSLSPELAKLKSDEKLADMTARNINEAFSMHADVTNVEGLKNLPKRAVEHYLQTEEGEKWLFTQLQNAASQTENPSNALIETFKEQEIENPQEMTKTLFKEGQTYNYGLFWQNGQGKDFLPAKEVVPGFQESLKDKDFLSQTLTYIQEKNIKN